MDAAWNLACLHIARKIEDSSPPWDETTRRCARIARAALKTDDVGEAGASRLDAPVATGGPFPDPPRGPSDAPATPDAEPLPAREPIPEPAPDDTNAGGGAPALWEGVAQAGYTGMLPCSRCGVVVVWYSSSTAVCNDCVRVDQSKCFHPLIVNGRCRECRAFVERYDGVVVTYTASVDQRDLHRGGK